MNSQCQPVKLSDAGGVTFEIAVDAESVYWTESDGSRGHLQKVGVTGLGFTSLAHARGIQGFVLGPQNVIFVEDFDKLVAVPKTGGELEVLVETGAGSPLAFDETHVYYMCKTPDRTSTGICKIPVRGGTPATSIPNTDAVAMTVHGGELFWISRDPSVIYKASATGGTPMRLATATSAIETLAVDATHVYWIEESKKELQRIVRSGATPVEVFATGASGKVVERDGSDVYWSTETDWVSAKPVAGGEARSLAGPKFATGLTFDAAYMYLVSPGFGVFKLER